MFLCSPREDHLTAVYAKDVRIVRCERWWPLMILLTSSHLFPQRPFPNLCIFPLMGGLEDFGITEGGVEDWYKPVVWWWNLVPWGVTGTAGLWWLVRSLGILTGNDSHSLWLWLISLPIVLIVNLHFLNYYGPPCAYARETPFNHLDSASLGSTFPHILAHNYHFSLFVGRQNNITRVKVRISHERAPPPNRTTPETSRAHPISHLSTTKVSFTPRCNIPRRCAPMEDFFSCVSHNHFPVHSHCSSFAVTLVVDR